MIGRMKEWLGFSGHHAHDHDHGSHGHHHEGNHGHTHGIIDPSLTTTAKGIFAIKWSFVILAITAALQMIVVAVSGSVALLADGIHNGGEAAPGIPL